MEKLRVYIAGPLTLGPRPKNINEALRIATLVRIRGHIPFVPHLFELWDMIFPQHYEFWMELDLEWIKACDILIRISGESKGADREVAFAESLKIPVYFGLESFINSKNW